MPKGIKQPIPFTPEQLADLYNNQRLGVYRIAALADVKPGVVKRWLKVYEIETRHKSVAPPKDVLIDLYLTKGMTFVAIGEQFGVCRRAVQRWIVNYGIELREYIDAPADSELQRLYIGERLSTNQLANLFGVCQTTATSWLDKAGIELRPSGTGLQARGLALPSRDELYNWLHVEHLTYKQIAEKFSLDHSAVYHWVKKYGIEKPSIGGKAKCAIGATLPTVEQFITLYNSGLSLDRVGDMFGVPVSVVRRFCRQNNLAVRPDGWDGGKRVVCKDGTEVRSTYEQRVADWLFERGIAYVYEPSLPFGNMRGDFYVNGRYIEIWGVKNSPEYNARRDRKKQGYKDAGLPLIGIYSQYFLSGAWERKLQQAIILS